MALFKNDLSEYVTPRRAGHARLVVTLEGVDGKRDAHVLTARLHGDMIGQFIEYPDGRSPDASLLTSKISPDEAPSAKVGTQPLSAHFFTALSRSWGPTVERGQQRGSQITIRSSSAVRTVRRDRSQRNTTRGRALTKARRTSGFAAGQVGARRTSVPIGKPTEVVEGGNGGPRRGSGAEQTTNTCRRRTFARSRSPTSTRSCSSSCSRIHRQKYLGGWL